MELTLTGATLAGGGVGGSTPSSPSKAQAAAAAASAADAHQHGPGCNHDHSHSHVTGSASHQSSSQASPVRIRLPTHHTLPPEVLRRQLVQLSTNPTAFFMALVGTVKVGSYESFVAFADGVRELEKERGASTTILAERGGDGHTLCHWAAKRSEDVRFLEYFASIPGLDLHSPSTDSVGMYPIHWAATEGSIALVSFLLRHLIGVENGSCATSSDGDIINARDGSGCTPLLIAAQYGHADLAAFLLKRGADGSAVDSSSDTALHWAAYKGSVPVCGLLLHLHGVGGHIDNIDDFGQTPLHLAAMRGNVEVAQYLLEEAEVYMDRQARGEVQMSLPTQVGGRDSSFAGYLLTVQDKDGKTALDLAIKKKKEGSEMVLRDYINRHCAPKPNVFTLIRRTCVEMFSPKAWKVWMGMNPEAASGAQSPKFPFYFVIGNIIVAFLFYPLVFLPMWATSDDPGLLYDLMSVHIFSLTCQIIMWVSFVLTWKTDPGTLGNSSTIATSDFTARGRAYALSCGLDQSTEIQSEMDGITRVLRRKYDETLEEYSADAIISKQSSEGTIPSTPKKDHAALCHSCRIVKPLRSKHCRVARRCVLLFDHYCPFVGATIGLYNYRFFYTFLVTLVLALLTFIGTLIVYIERSPRFHPGVTIVGLLISLIVIPTGGLLIYHTQLIWRNLTTNEHQNFYRYKYFQHKEGGAFYNPFDRGFLRNLLSRCLPGEDSYIIFENDGLFGENGGSVSFLSRAKDTGGKIEMTPRNENTEVAIQPSESVIVSASEKINGGSGGGAAERRSAAKRRVSDAVSSAAVATGNDHQEMKSLL
jgi:ankyrin repeat protein